LIFVFVVGLAFVQDRAVRRFFGRRPPATTAAPAVKRIPIDGRPSAVAVAGGRVWVADDEHHSVHAIDERTLREVTRALSVDRNPVALYAEPNGPVWVAHASGSVRRIDARSLHVGPSIETGGSLTGVTVLSPNVWVTDLTHDRLVAIDEDRGKVVRTIGVPQGAVRVESDHFRNLWVSGREDTVTKVNVETEHRSVYRVGVGPIGLGLDGEDVWVANSDDDTVTRLRKGSRSTFPAGRAPIAVAFTDGITTWVADQDGATLTRLPDSWTGSRRPRLTIRLGVHPRGLVSADNALWVVGTNAEALVRVGPIGDGP
jgi:streptogramin lyase